MMVVVKDLSEGCAVELARLRELFYKGLRGRYVNSDEQYIWRATEDNFVDFVEGALIEEFDFT